MSTMIGVSNITNRTDPNSLKSRVFVGNLNTVQMSKTELESIFAKYGAVIGISVHKGYAFIQYSNEASARAAVLGEDLKAYYNMALDVTVASEPKNRKRGRSNINANNSSWNSLPSPSFTDLTMQAQTLSTLANNPMISLQQLGLEGIMGQPNLAQFAAAATSVLSGAPFSGLNVPTQPAPSLSSSRPKYNRLSSAANSSSASMAHLSSSAKRTRLEGTVATASHFNSSSSSSVLNNTLPAGARGQNLVSLVSPTNLKPAQGRSSASTGSLKTEPPSSRSKSTVGLPASSSAGARPSTANQLGVDRLSAAQPKSTTPSPSTIAKTPSRLPSCSPKTSQPSVVAPGGVSVGLAPTERAETCMNSSISSSRSQPDDILICGSCRKLFDQVDELISHKMAGCSLGKTTCDKCRCRTGEPTNLECAYCGVNFSGAWDLMHHCHNDHGLTIYSIKSPRGSTAPPNSIRRLGIVKGSDAMDSGSRPSGSSSAPSRPDSGNEETGSITNRDTSPSAAPRKDGDLRGTVDGDAQQPGAGSGVSDWDADDEYDGEVTDVGEVEQMPEEDINGDENVGAEDQQQQQLEESTGVAMSSPVKQQQQTTTDTDGADEDRADSVSPSKAVEQRSSSVEFDGTYTECGPDSTSVPVKPESSSSPCHHRTRRRGEYGRHETIVDDDEEEEEDDEENESSAASKLPRSG